MNSYSLGITGFWIVAVVLVIAAIVLSVLMYRTTVPPISGRRKTLLIAIRALAMILLIIAVFEPILTILSGNNIAPRLAVFLDNSISTGIQDASGDRKKQYIKAVEGSDFKSIDKSDLKIALFDDNIKRIDNFAQDSINHKGQLTNISKVIRWANNNLSDENIRAALLITDGAFNSGDNPIYDAELFGKPIYIIGIGDSTEPKDISIQTIVSNDVAYIDTPVPVNVNLIVNGINTDNVKLQLYENNQLIGEQIVNVTKDRINYSAIFEYVPKIAGTQKLTARAAQFDGEISNKNNELSEFIDVLKNKKSVAIITGSLNSDVSFFKNEVSKESGIEVALIAQKNNQDFYNPNILSDISKAEIIALIGFPVSSTPQNIITAIKNQLDKGKELIFIASYDTDYSKLKLLEDYLPFSTITSRQQEFMAVPDIKSDALSNPLIRVNGNEDDLDLWNNLPPLFRTETFVRVKPESEIVSTLKVNNVPLREPLILTRSFQDKKSVAILGYGLYRWKLLGYAADAARGRDDKPDLYSIFIKNAVRWLSVSDDNKMIRIKTTKKLYSNAENIEFIGQVYDDAFAPIDNANVFVKVSGGKDDREIMLNPAGNGRYTGKLAGLPPGDYAYKAEVKFAGKIIGGDEGRFSVGDISIEYQNLRMNAAALRSIAERTGGKFYTPETASNFINDLNNSNKFKPQSITSRMEFAIWNTPWLLIAAILLFAIEWIIRKRSGMV